VQVTWEILIPARHTTPTKVGLDQEWPDSEPVRNVNLKSRKLKYEQSNPVLQNVEESGIGPNLQSKAKALRPSNCRVGC
jgi:hypothetical protein